MAAGAGAGARLARRRQRLAGRRAAERSLDRHRAGQSRPRMGLSAFPEPQYGACIELCRAIVARWPIPPRRVLGHSDVAPARKQDPGELFDWPRLAAAGIGLWPKAGAGAPRTRATGAGRARPLRLCGAAARPPRRRRRQLVIAAFQRHFRPAAGRRRGRPRDARPPRRPAGAALTGGLNSAPVRRDISARVRRPDGRSRAAAPGEESPGSTETRCRVTPGGGDPRESATESSLPAGASGRACGSRVKGCGKSAPRRRQRRRHGKPHREQDQVGTTAPAAAGRPVSGPVVRVGRARRPATGVPEEWPSPGRPLRRRGQNPAYRLPDPSCRTVLVPSAVKEQKENKATRQVLPAVFCGLSCLALVGRPAPLFSLRPILCIGDSVGYGRFFQIGLD